MSFRRQLGDAEPIPLFSGPGLVGRIAGGHQRHPIQPQRRHCREGDFNVAVVYRIQGSAQYANLHGRASDVCFDNLSYRAIAGAPLCGARRPSRPSPGHYTTLSLNNLPPEIIFYTNLIEAPRKTPYNV